MVLLQYYSRLQYSQGVGWFYYWFTPPLVGGKILRNCQHPKLSGKAGSGCNNSHIFKQNASEAEELACVVC